MKLETVNGSCSCCGAEPNGKTWFVYRAGWCDTDGVFYPRLCGDASGIGCISEVKPAHNSAAERARLLMELMPEEIDDGVVTMMEDYLDGVEA